MEESGCENSCVICAVEPFLCSEIRGKGVFSSIVILVSIRSSLSLEKGPRRSVINRCWQITYHYDEGGGLEPRDFGAIPTFAIVLRCDLGQTSVCSPILCLPCLFSLWLKLYLVCGGDSHSMGNYNMLKLVFIPNQNKNKFQNFPQNEILKNCFKSTKTFHFNKIKCSVPV